MSFHVAAMRTDIPGEALCALDDIPDGQGRGFVLLDEEAGAARQIFVVRQGRRVHGYLNSCPHAGTPLDFKPDTFIAPDGASIQCSTHGARFRIVDGSCLAGPCCGQGLIRVRVRVDGERVIRLDAPE